MDSDCRTAPHSNQKFRQPEKIIANLKYNSKKDIVCVEVPEKLYTNSLA